MKTEENSTTTVTVYPAASSLYKTRSYFLPKKSISTRHSLFFTKPPAHHITATTWARRCFRMALINATRCMKSWVASVARRVSWWLRYVMWWICKSWHKKAPGKGGDGKKNPLWKGGILEGWNFWVPRVYTCLVDVLVVSDPSISINRYHIEYTWKCGRYLSRLDHLSLSQPNT